MASISLVQIFMLLIFSLLNAPGLLFSLWVLAHGFSRLLSGEVTPQRPGPPLLALLWHFLITGGLWSLVIYPGLGQACEKECGMVLFPREAGPALRGGALVGGAFPPLSYSHRVRQLPTTSTQQP